MARKRGKKSASAPRPRPRPGRQPQGGAEVQAAIQATVARLNQGDVQGAAGAIQHGLHLTPEHPDLLHLGGQVAAHLGDPEQGKYDEAFRLFRQGNELKRFRFDRLGHTVWVEQVL